MTYKGKTFTREDAAQMLGKGRMQRMQRKMDAAKVASALDAEAARLTEQYRIVAMDRGYPVIAEEMTERILRRLGEVARPIANDLLRQPAAVRLAVIAAFDRNTGELINTLEPAPTTKKGG